MGLAGVLTAHLVTGDGSSASAAPSTPTPRPTPSASATPSAAPDTEPATGTRKVLTSPYDLAPGASVANGKVRLTMQTDGNLVISDANGRPLWAAMTQGRGDHAGFQRDGNLVVSNADDKAVWGAGSFGHPDAVLVLRADGNVVIEDGGTVLWQTNTAR
ncbi:hypothetical protein ACI2L1_02170 [Streptomyces sp. NPDC019531]|uniref:hypothetical protein n=1 Tax=Streptomyces sp. NPDC019531 TaxID=3365062 RepID=UPI00384EE13D